MTDSLVETPELVLLGGEEDLETGLRRFDPGAVIPGAVRLRPHRHVRCRGVYLVARWRASAKGGVDDGGHAREQRIHQGPLDPETSVELQFQYELPFEPWSYEGQLIRIDWQLEVHLDVPWGRDLVASQQFILAPTPPFDRPTKRRRGAATRKREGN